jgi:predicted CoA-binding protein
MHAMAHQNPKSDAIRKLLEDARTIAVVGASSKIDRPSHSVMKVLLHAGYRVIPVNPNEASVLGQKCYASLRDIPEHVDIVDVFRQPQHTPEIADQAVAIGAKVLWLQLGVVNEDAAARAKAGGLTVVMDACIAVQHELLLGSSPA